MIHGAEGECSQSKKDATMDDLAAVMKNVVAHLLARGWRPPFYFTAIAWDGAVTYGCCADEGRGNFSITANGPEFELPVNLMLANANGKAVRMLIGQSTEPEQIIFH